MTSYNRDGKSGPWAIEKWNCLQNYLEAYTKVFLNQDHWKIYYIDAFAGTGRASIRSETSEVSLFRSVTEDPDYLEFANGSALRALNTENPFDGYLFIELNKKRAKKLEESIENHPRKNLCRIRVGSAKEILLERFIENPKISKNNTRAICFLDPFGMQVDWVLLEKIAQLGFVEVMINFPLGMAIQRLLPRKGAPTSANIIKLNHFFGGSDWYENAYQTNQDLFGESSEKSQDADTRILHWYNRKLEKAFGYVATPRLIRNRTGGHLYYLMWAGPHSKGFEIADHVMKMMAGSSLKS